MRKRNPGISKNSNTCDENTETTKRMDLKKLSVALLSATLVIMTLTFGLVSPALAGELALTPDAATPQGVSDPCPAGPDSFGYVCAPVARLPLPAFTDIGNHCDDCVTPNVPIGFAFSFYDQTFTMVRVSSNGNVQFLSGNPAFSNVPLPYTGFRYAILPYWDDLRTDGFCGQGVGVFRGTSGAAPFRVFVLEWRACYPKVFPQSIPSGSVTFQLQLEESTSDIYFVYGANVPPPSDSSHFNGGSATSGIQQGTGQAFLQHTFNRPVLTPGSAVVFTRRTQLTLEPKTAINPVDSQHCVTATVTTISRNPVSGVTVRFQVTGSVNTGGTRVTDQNGQATFCYTGPRLPGADAIRAFADFNRNNVQDQNEPGDAASKTWILPVSTPGCEVIITNGGWIIATNGDRASFGGNAHVDSIGNVNGQEEYQDHGPAQDMTLHGNVLVVVCSRDFTHATIFGQADVTGFGSGTHVYRLDVADLSQSGTNDRYSILVANGYDSGDQQLMGGNVQIHPSA